MHFRSQSFYVATSLLFVVGFVACSSEEAAQADDSGVRYNDHGERIINPDELFDPTAVVLTDPDLIAGREVWMGTCAECHITGRLDAPKIADKSDWAPRIAQGMDVMYKHAIEGFTGDTFNEMPAKGGNRDLTDEQVKQAVRFVVSASQ